VKCPLSGPFLFVVLDAMLISWQAVLPERSYGMREGLRQLVLFLDVYRPMSRVQ